MDQKDTNKLFEDLGFIKAEISAIKEKIGEINDCVNTFEDRIINLEKWRERISGQIMAWSSIGGFAVGIIVILMKSLADKYIK